METVFFYLIFFKQVKTMTDIRGNQFFGGKSLFPLAKRDFLSSENYFVLFRASFLQVKTVTEAS